MNLSQSNVIYVKTDGKPQNLRVHVVTEAGQDIPVGPVIHTIVSEAEGNWQPGAVFTYPGAVPPEGAYLLNGQTIPNCADAYPKFWEWVNTAGVWLIDNDTYEAELAKYGVCDGFVIDSAAGSVRLPTKKYQTPLGDTLPVRGNGIAVGVTNGSANGGLFSTANSSLGFYSSADLLGDAVTSSIPSITNPVNGILGLVEDPAVSGIVAENNAPVDRFVWCIQVYNAATALSEQESAQLASQMQTKAQTDLANVTANIDFIIKHEEATDGSWWYDLYRSGKVVQSVNLVAPSTTWALITVTLPIEMADNKYTVQRTFTTTTTATSVNFNRLGVYERSETAITCSTNSGLIPDNLLIIGKAATE